MRVGGLWDGETVRQGDFGTGGGVTPRVRCRLASLFVLLMTMLLLPSPSCLAQGAPPSPLQPPLLGDHRNPPGWLEIKLRHFHADKVPVVLAVEALNRHLQFQFAFEQVPCKGVTDADFIRPVSLDLSNVTLRQVFDALAAQNPAITWREERDGFLRFLPAAAAGDPGYLLLRRIPDLRLAGISGEEARARIASLANTAGLPFPSYLSLYPQYVPFEDEHLIRYNLIRKDVTIREAFDQYTSRARWSWGVQFDPDFRGYPPEFSDMFGLRDEIKKVIVDCPGEGPPLPHRLCVVRPGDPEAGGMDR